MSLWGKNDNAANSAIFATQQVNRATTSANRTELFGNVTSGVYATGQTVGQFGVDAAETKAVPGTSQGWNLRIEGSGGRAGRVTHECLVALKSMIGDASDDARFPDLAIIIRGQPQSKSVPNNSATTFSVDAVSAPEGATLTYQWQVNGSNLAATGVYSNVTTPTLAISNVASLTGNSYGVLVYATGAATVRSANATLTVV